MFKYVWVIYPTNKLLHEICSILCPWQTCLQKNNKKDVQWLLPSNCGQPSLCPGGMQTPWSINESFSPAAGSLPHLPLLRTQEIHKLPHFLPLWGIVGALYFPVQLVAQCKPLSLHSCHCIKPQGFSLSYQFKHGDLCPQSSPSHPWPPPTPCLYSFLFRVSQKNLPFFSYHSLTGPRKGLASAQMDTPNRIHSHPSLQ